MNLYVIYIGGNHEDSLIELHDLRFIVADSIQDTYETLRNSWWGISSSLHIDAWGILNHVDGYRIELEKKITKTKSPEKEPKLFFANLSGFSSNELAESHKNIFVVAFDEKEAKEKALDKVKDWGSPHRDYLYAFDALVDLNLFLKRQGYHLFLIKDEKEEPFVFTCAYHPLEKKR